MARRTYHHRRIVRPDGRIVEAIQYIGTNLIRYTVWESGRAFSTHRTISYLDGDTCFGTVRSRIEPAEYNELPAYSDERSNAFTGWYATCRAESRRLIEETCPETCAAHWSDGEATMTLEQLPRSVRRATA